MSSRWSSRRNLLIAAALVIFILVIVWLANRTSPDQEPAATPPQVEQQPASQDRFRPRPTPPSAPTEPAGTPLPPVPASLDNSDPAVLEAVGSFAPALTAWLTPDQQIRKWVLAIDNLATGEVPAQHRPLAYDIGKFQVEQQAGRLVMSEKNYHRAQSLIDTIVAIPPEQLARYYHHWLPTLDKAYAELGRDNNFDSRLRAAIDHVLAVEPLQQSPELEQPSVFYIYAEEELEEADDLTKLMWRLGPENTRRIQDYLRNLKKTL